MTPLPIYFSAIQCHLKCDSITALRSSSLPTRLVGTQSFHHGFAPEVTVLTSCHHDTNCVRVLVRCSGFPQAPPLSLQSHPSRRVSPSNFSLLLVSTPRAQSLRTAPPAWKARHPDTGVCVPVVSGEDFEFPCLNADLLQLIGKIVLFFGPTILPPFPPP